MFDLWLKGAVRWLSVAGLCLFIFCLWASLNDASAADAIPVPTVTLQGAVADILGQVTQQTPKDSFRVLVLIKAIG